MIQESRTFLIGDGGECVIGVFALEVYNESGEFVVFAEVCDRI